MPLTYKIKRDDKVFVDTNILIFLFSPSFVNSSGYQISKYSSVFASLVANNCNLYVNSHVISEFINRCLRIDFDNNFNIKKNKNYKRDYRRSTDYTETIKIVLKELKKFLKLANHINDDFVSFDIDRAYRVTKESDFNDLIIADTVIKNNLKLLSDDGDFKISFGIDTDWYLL